MQILSPILNLAFLQYHYSLSEKYGQLCSYNVSEGKDQNSAQS